MNRLDATNKTLEVVLAGAVTSSDLPVVVSYSDYDTSTGTLTLAETDTVTNGVTTVTILAAPASGVVRNVDSLSIYNQDSAAATVTVQLHDNTTVRIEKKATLQPGETLQYLRQTGWG
jgi:hypothetical protein